MLFAYTVSFILRKVGFESTIFTIEVSKNGPH